MWINGPSLSSIIREALSKATGRFVWVKIPPLVTSLLGKPCPKVNISIGWVLLSESLTSKIKLPWLVDPKLEDFNTLENIAAVDPLLTKFKPSSKL